MGLKHPKQILCDFGNKITGNQAYWKWYGFSHSLSFGSTRPKHIADGVDISTWKCRQQHTQIAHRHRERVGLDQTRSHRGGTAVSASPCHAKVDVRIIRTPWRCSEWTPVNGIVNRPVKQKVNAQVHALIDERANEPVNELWMRQWLQYLINPHHGTSHWMH